MFEAGRRHHRGAARDVVADHFEHVRRGDAHFKRAPLAGRCACEPKLPFDDAQVCIGVCGGRVV
jgi:hypothetical protein